MSDVNIRLLAKELKLSIGTVSKALKDSYEISVETKKRVSELAKQLNYHPNPYASSLRRKKSNTIAVVLPEVADSFFSLAIKGVESVAQSKGYHVLIYLTYESYYKEVTILDDFKNGRVDGVLMSISSETITTKHIEELDLQKIPIVFFDRAIYEFEAAKVVTNDFESGYVAAEHLINSGCEHLAYLSINKNLSINNKRIQGYLQATTDHKIHDSNCTIIDCTNDVKENYNIISYYLKNTSKPIGIIASVEKLITPVYLLSKNLNMSIPEKLKVISFSNLQTAEILQPALTTITQPAFEIGKAAAVILFKALEKPNYNYHEESVVIPSIMHIRESTKM